MKEKTFTFALLLSFLLVVGPHSAAAQERVTDKEIDLAVENRILQSEEVRSKDLRAEVADGIVTLAGRVDNLHASNQAARLAGEVRGVKSIVNQIIVEPAKVSDKNLAMQVRQALALNFPVDASDVQVEAERGNITLSGEVESLAEERLAASTAASVKGVMEIENNLNLASIADPRSDKELRTEITELIDNSALLDESEIEVQVKDGVAELIGRVANLTQKTKAVELASLKGITKVRDGGLRVEWKKSDGMQRRERFENLTDDKIQNAIELGMRHHPLLVAVANKIDVELNRGKVTLSGTVNRLVMKEAAAEVARETIGVQGVRNRLRVDWPEEAPTDKEIMENIQQALNRDAYLGFAEIIPRSRNAHAHLYGVVDTNFEKKRAAYIAGAQPGVVHVANYLAVIGEWDPRPDEEIEEALRQKLALLESDPHVDVTVNVTNGVPVFNGHVATWYQWQGLVRIAEEAGARRPHVDVSIHYRPTPSGPELYVPQ